MNFAEVVITYSRKTFKKGFQITNSYSALKVLKEIYPKNTIEHHEYFFILLLDRANKVLGWAKVAEGGISSMQVDIRIIFQLALGGNASAFIISHNHPSGSILPSKEDIAITHKIKKAAEVLDLTLTDHIIVTASDEYYSFADECTL